MKLLAALVLCLSCAAGHATALWNLDLHGVYADTTFDLQGQFTTASADYSNGLLVTSFTGTFSDAYEIDQPVTLIPLGPDVAAGPGLTFTYDNLFFGPTGRPGFSIDDAFDSNGLLLHAGLSAINVFGGATYPIGYDYHDGSTYEALVDGTITLASISSPVREPATWALLALGLVLLVKTPRRTGR